MILRIALVVVLMLALPLQAFAQRTHTKSVGTFATKSIDKTLPITLEFELALVSPESVVPLIQYLDSQDFKIQILYKLKKGGDPSEFDSITLQASRSAIFTAAEIDLIVENALTLTPEVNRKSSRWRFHQQQK